MLRIIAKNPEVFREKRLAGNSSSPWHMAGFWREAAAPLAHGVCSFLFPRSGRKIRDIFPQLREDLNRFALHLALLPITSQVKKHCSWLLSKARACAPFPSALKSAPPHPSSRVFIVRPSESLTLLSLTALNKI